MKFIETSLNGTYILENDIIKDERGWFARSFCKEEFEAHGLSSSILQCNVSFNYKKGTIRGMHYQDAPYGEVKTVICTQGAIYDVIIDLRPQSPTFCRWFGVQLIPSNNKMLYIPEGCAHGFQALEDNTVVFYRMSQYYMPEYAKGVRWNDPAFGIQWPLPLTVISDRDKNMPDFIRE